MSDEERDYKSHRHEGDEPDVEAHKKSRDVSESEPTDDDFARKEGEDGDDGDDVEAHRKLA